MMLASAWPVSDVPPNIPAAPAVFDHPHNVNVGAARVIFAEACTPAHAAPCERGWVLPGGIRTTNRAIAEMVAGRMDDAIRTGYLTVPV